jgi:membrane associated rhomboid family serine protease
VIPIRDANPTRRRPWVTLGLIALNLAAFFLWQGGPMFGQPTTAQQEIWACYGAIPYELTHFEPAPQFAPFCSDSPLLLPLLTSMFLHANLLHVGGNMLFLWVFGNNVEDRMSPLVFLLFYLVAGVVAAYVQVLIAPNDQIPLIGASGAIAGVLGAYIVMFPRARVLTLVIFFFITAIELPALVVLGLWFLFQAFSGIGTLGGPAEGGVAFFAHMGGFVFGVLVALLFYRTRRPPQPAYGWPG